MLSLPEHINTSILRQRLLIGTGLSPKKKNNDQNKTICEKLTKLTCQNVGTVFN